MQIREFSLVALTYYTVFQTHKPSIYERRKKVNSMFDKVLKSIVTEILRLYLSDYVLNSHHTICMLECRIIHLTMIMPRLNKNFLEFKNKNINEDSSNEVSIT